MSGKTTVLSMLPLAALLCVGFALPVPVRGGSTYWQYDPNLVGDWFDANHWTAGLPGAWDYAYVDNGGTALISAGSGETQCLRVGYADGGAVVQTGGVTTIDWSLELGDQSAASGTYELSGDGELRCNGTEYVGHSGTGTFTQTGGTNTVESLYVGRSVGSNGTYEQSANAVLTADWESVGRDGTGTFTQTGGTNTVECSLSLGYGSDGNGTYELSGEGVLTADWEYVGYDGTGTFRQTGGTNTIQGSLSVGLESGSSGTYELSGNGELSACRQYVGYDGRGTFTQSGGTNTVEDCLYVGSGSDGSNTYDQSGGTNIVGDLEIGPGGRYVLTGGTLEVRTFLLLAGELDFAGSSVAVTWDNVGVNFITGDVLNAGYASLSLGPNTMLMVPAGFDPNAVFGSFSSGGMIHTAGTTLVVAAGKGFAWTGEINDHVYCEGHIAPVPGRSVDMRAGLEVAGAGSVDLGDGTLTVNDAISGISGGEISARYMHVGDGNTGTFTQTGGMNTVHFLRVGYSSDGDGTYELSGDGELSANEQYVGYQGAGTFTQSGGTNKAYDLSIGADGRYVLTGGTLALRSFLILEGQLDFAGSSAAVAWDHVGVSFIQGDVLHAGNASMSLGANTILMVRAGFDPNAVFGSFSSDGIVHTAGTTLVIPAGADVAWAGAIEDHVHCEGTIAVLPGQGDVGMAAGLEVAGEGVVDLGGGRLTVNDVVSGLSGGRLLAKEIRIGDGNTGTFTQTGGTNRVGSGGYLYLGYDSDGNGTYELSGDGELSAYEQYVGYSGSGTFRQTGGTNTVDHTLDLGFEAGSRGTYELGDGELECDGTEYVGWYGTGTFTQTAGTNTIHGDVYLGYWPGSNGTYDLAGTGQLRAGQAFVGHDGNGTFTQTGETSTVALNLYLGYNATVHGTYELDGNAELFVSRLYVGHEGTGTFTQSGGKSTVTMDLSLGSGHGADGDGTYELDGNAELFVSRLYVGHYGTGTFTQTGGKNTVTNYLYVGYRGQGTYELSANGVLTADSERVGHNRTGTFTQTGGTNTAGDLEIGTKGRYVLAGGMLQVDDCLLVDGELDIEGTPTAVVGDLEIGRGGFVTADACSTVQLMGDFHNESTRAGDFDLSAATVQFRGDGVQELEAAGEDMGACVAGWTENFVLGVLLIEPGAIVRLVDDADNSADAGDPEAVYVGELVIQPGGWIDLNGLHLYYLNGGDPKELFYGDSDLDGDVDWRDYAALKGNFGAFAGEAGWPDGDMTGDGVVDYWDYVAVRDNYGSSTELIGSPAGAIPEPATLLLVALPAAALLRRRFGAPREEAAVPAAA